MKKNPLVTVVIPCYNHEIYIKETIQSVLQSTYNPLEIVIVNDGSTDQSEAVVNTLVAVHKNVFLFNQRNSGPSIARNHAIEKANGKYILPLDADDLISDDYIEKAIFVLESCSRVKLVYCEADFFHERTGKWNLPDFKIERLATDNMIFCSAIYRKTDWEKAGGYDDRMTWGWEDWEFWISMLKHGGEVVKLPISGFKYRVRRNSRRKSTNKYAKKKTIQLINEKHSDFVQRHLNGPLRYQRSLSKAINFFRMNMK